MTLANPVARQAYQREYHATHREEAWARNLIVARVPLSTQIGGHVPKYMITVTLTDYDTGPEVEIEEAQKRVIAEFQAEYPGAAVDVTIEPVSCDC